MEVAEFPGNSIIDTVPWWGGKVHYQPPTVWQPFLEITPSGLIWTLPCVGLPIAEGFTNIKGWELNSFAMYSETTCECSEVENMSKWDERSSGASFERPMLKPCSEPLHIQEANNLSGCVASSAFQKSRQTGVMTWHHSNGISCNFFRCLHASIAHSWEV